MQYNYKYKSGETFTYKWWHITIDSVFGGTSKINFSIDGSSIYFAVSAALKESGAYKDIRVQAILNAAFSETVSLRPKPVDSITVTHMFKMWEKCRRDAQSHIDNVLGDGLSYAKKHNLYPSLSTFL